MCEGGGHEDRSWPWVPSTEVTSARGGRRAGRVPGVKALVDVREWERSGWGQYRHLLGFAIQGNEERNNFLVMGEKI